MNGELSIRTSKSFDLRQLKALSKNIEVSINDIVTAAITTAFQQIFKEAGDPAKEINLVLPASVRFKFYPTRESLKLENKFAAMALRLPLTESMEAAYPKIQKVTAAIRGGLPYLYASYSVAHWFNKLMPNCFMTKFVDDLSEKFTVSFSNTPGPIKPFVFDVKPECVSRTLVCYLMVPGKLGLNISAISMINNFRFAITSDTGLFDNNARLIELIENNLDKQIAKNKTLKIPASPASGKKIKER
jgi:hypothetical protein